MYSRPEYAEQSLDIMETLLRGGDVDLIALDSIAFLTPIKEIEESVDKETMGVQPRLMGKGIRKLVSALTNAKNERGHLPTIFFTNRNPHEDRRHVRQSRDAARRDGSSVR